jgi:light-regulated signal transduction histidine kinase (bacteriophytochrome)
MPEEAVKDKEKIAAGKKKTKGIAEGNGRSNTAAPENWKLLEEIVYIISHDLQVPLISMDGYATELEEKYKKSLDEDGIYCLERLKANTRRMYLLVLSLLDLSRLNTRKYPHESFDAAAMVKEIVRELTTPNDGSGINIEVEEMPRMRGDKQRLAGVFRQLISNALIYGGKNITIGCRSGTWFVKDDGIGIPPNQLENIFKGGARLKRIEVEGVGMGLTFCKYVIHQHGGKIWAESDGENKGAAFYFNVNT